MLQRFLSIVLGIVPRATGMLDKSREPLPPSSTEVLGRQMVLMFWRTFVALVEILSLLWFVSSHGLCEEELVF